MKKILAILLSLGVVAGCHAQVPPATSHAVDLTWTAPAASSTWGGCTTAAPCVYAVYRCTGTASACGTLSSTAWAEVTTAATRPGGTSYSDTTVSGGTSYTYAVETVQGPEYSGPSNTTTAAVPATPLAPAIGSPTVAHVDGQPLPEPTMAGELAKIAPVTALRQGE